MKIIKNDTMIIIFFNKKININLKKIHIYLRKLFKQLKLYTLVNLSDINEIIIYNDQFYGNIIELKLDQFNYSYFNQLDTKVKLINSNFLYQIDYSLINSEIINNCDIYILQGKIYLKMKNNIINEIIEKSNIVYGNKVKYVLQNGKKIKL